MSIATVLPAGFVRTVQIFTVVFALSMVFAAVPMQAKAAPLTDAQINAILSLLSSFGADPEVVANVERDMRGTTTTTPSGLWVRFASGSKATYAPGEKIVLFMHATEQSDSSAGTPDEGYNVQVALEEVGGTASLQSLNATYDPRDEYWHSELTAPTDVSKTYKVEATFYCSNSQLSCGQKFPSGGAQGTGQVTAYFNFTLAGSITPVITALSSDYPSYVAGTNNATFTWARTGEFASVNNYNYYFVYLKKTPKQLLGSSDSQWYVPILFRVSNLAYPNFGVVLPSEVPSGTYYLELDYTDINGVPITSKTSNAFTIASSVANPSFTAQPKSGNAPLEVTFHASGITVFNTDTYVSFGDGSKAYVEKDTCNGSLCYVAVHTYTNEGAYVAKLNKAGTDLASLPITVAPAAIPFASINPASLISTNGTLALTGTAKNVTTLGMTIGSSAGDKVYGNTNIPVVNGKWSVRDATVLPNGNYKVQVFSSTNVLLTTGELTVKRPPPAPTATLTATPSGVVKVGDRIVYAWSSTNAVSAASTYTTDSPQCGKTTRGPFVWIAKTLADKTAGTIASCQAGHTYTITYKVTAADGRTASAVATVKVAPLADSTSLLNTSAQSTLTAATVLSDFLVGAVIVAPFTAVVDVLGNIFYQLGVY